MTELPQCCERHVTQAGIPSPTVCKCGRTLVVRDRKWIMWRDPKLPQGWIEAMRAGKATVIPSHHASEDRTTRELEAELRALLPLMREAMEGLREPVPPSGIYSSDMDEAMRFHLATARNAALDAVIKVLGLPEPPR